MKLPKPISKLIESFERLPGIGPKTAQRLTFHLLHFPEEELKTFSDALTGLKSSTYLCSVCKNVSDAELCSVCADDARDKTLIAVVAHPLDTFALERTGFTGVYHVLHGIIDPLNNVGPEELFIKDLLSRVTSTVENMELILATTSSMEGEATSMYITKMIRDLGRDADSVKITRIARGLPVGGDIEYADDITLRRALEGRSLL